MRNNNKILTLSIIFLLTLTTIYVSAASMAPAKAADTATYIQKYTIKDGTTGDFIYSNDLTTGSASGNLQISNGQELQVTVTIKISTSNPSSSLTLSTGMAHPSGDHYWAHDSSDGYNLGAYNPNSASFSFTQTAGTFTITCFGVASGVVATSAGGITLHKSVPVSLVALKDPSGTILDEIKPNITDASINEYNTKLKDAQNKLSSLGGADPSWTSLAQNVISASQTVADQGLTDNAIAMLDSLNNASAPASGALQILFIPLIAIFAVLAGLFGFMFMRNRSKVSYYKLVVEDQIKDLEGLTLRASKIDRTMASNLDGVKDRLKRLVGM